MSKDTDQPIFSFAIVADTHLTKEEKLSFEGSDASGNRLAALYDDLIARVNAMKPEFVVHLGDITDPVPVSPEFGDSARAFHAASDVFDMPYYLVPGNHDIGEKIHPALPSIDDNVSITKRAIGQYEQHFGRQRYSFEHRDCLFVVINTMLMNSGLEEEQEQWDWLEQTLSGGAGKRVFMFAHYPLYLSAPDEPAYYDNIDEPARSRLIDLFAKHPVEGYYAGHVHNFFYNNLNGMHQFVLPSTGIIRTDYMEFFRTTPTREMGRFDPAKLGFFWVDVYVDHHVPHMIRSGEKRPYQTHSWSNTAASVTLDLRIPWCEEVDIPCAWGLEIFERKYIRNDYPLAAIWEMGVRDLRIPVSDLVNPRISKRVKELEALGHRFTVVMMGLPNEERRAALADHAAGIKAIEIVSLFEQWREFAGPLKELRQGSDFEIYLHAVRAEVEGWTMHHGLHADLAEENDWALGLDELKDSVDGFVFGIRQDKPVLDEYTAIQEILSGTGHKALLHVPCVGMYWAMSDNDDIGETEEIARVAEATVLARAYPDVAVVVDNFVELDRGYCSCHGLIDRLNNPKKGARAMTALNARLPQGLDDVTGFEAGGNRIVMAKSGKGMALLIMATGFQTTGVLSDHVSDELANTQGQAIDLGSGEETTVSLSALIEQRAAAKTPLSPALLLLAPS